ncbi:uncharacterized protein [Primulina eburnea]|uniref:uncharacterized protein n=1 Tax=Primulina eburnea TaxID=1245227 RepID=UPI003C6C8488
MELQMVNVYIKNKWLEFQNEISLSHGYYVQQASIGIEFGVYNVINFQGSSSAKHRRLTHDIQRDDISCSCMKFQFEGIPCRHMLAFFRINQVFHLPDQYILKRWTKDAKIGVHYTMAEQNVVDDPERCLMSRHMRLSCKASALIDVTSFSDEGTNFLTDQFDCIDSKMKEMNINRTLRSGIQSRRTLDGAIGIIDPSEIRTKGRGKRLKSSKEKSTSRDRQCRGCERRGVSHDKHDKVHLSGQPSKMITLMRTQMKKILAQYMVVQSCGQLEWALITEINLYEVMFLVLMLIDLRGVHRNRDLKSARELVKLQQPPEPDFTADAD